MYPTHFGFFNGKSWEALCQQVFHLKHGTEGYQPMPASPGDYGIEGYTAHTGIAFQCYCPEKQCTFAVLYENQRDKITTDLGKLRKNEKALAARLGDTKIREWNFVTPTVEKNDLLAHAKAKQAEVRSWKLSIVSDDFRVLLRDGEAYLHEIRQVQSLNGQPLVFDLTLPSFEQLDGEAHEYEENVRRKSGLRVEGQPNAPKRAAVLTQATLANFLQSSAYLRKIEEGAPTLYFRLLRLLKEYEMQVVEASVTHVGTAEELTLQLRTALEARIAKDMGDLVDSTTASQITRHMMARWLAVCQLDFD